MITRQQEMNWTTPGIDNPDYHGMHNHTLAAYNALRKRNQVSKVIEAIPPPPPARKPVPVNESRQLQTEPVTVIEEDTRPVHEVLI